MKKHRFKYCAINVTINAMLCCQSNLVFQLVTFLHPINSSCHCYLTETDLHLFNAQNQSELIEERIT